MMKNRYKNIEGDILLIGGYPPPYGGVTVHIKRLAESCQEKGFKIHIVSQFTSDIAAPLIGIKGNALMQFVKLAHITSNYKGRIVHFHTSYLKRFLFISFPLLFFLKNKIKVITFHSGHLLNITRIRKYFFKLLINKFDYLIAVNKSQYSFLLDLCREKSKILHIPSFIPPKIISNQITYPKYEEIEALKKRTEILLMVSGYAKPYYGYDLLLEAVHQLKDISIGIIFVFYTAEDIKYKKKLMQRLSNEQNIIIIENLNSDEFLSLINVVDIYVRPNLIDSYGMVVAEALSLKTIVIASNVCPRHDGAIIFQSGNVDSLKSTLNKVIHNLEIENNRLSKIQIKDYSKDVIDLYHKILMDKTVG